MPDLKRRLILEIELPEMFVDDLLRTICQRSEIIRDHGSSETSTRTGFPISGRVADV